MPSRERVGESGAGRDGVVGAGGGHGAAAGGNGKPAARGGKRAGSGSVAVERVSVRKGRGQKASPAPKLDLVAAVGHHGPLDFRRQFAANLMQARARTGLSQAALGRRIGLDRGEISKFECGRREPRLKMIVRLARGLEVPVMDLLQGIEESDIPE